MDESEYQEVERVIWGNKQVSGVFLQAFHRVGAQEKFSGVVCVANIRVSVKRKHFENLDSFDFNTGIAHSALPESWNPYRQWLLVGRSDIGSIFFSLALILITFFSY